MFQVISQFLNASSGERLLYNLQKNPSLEHQFNTKYRSKNKELNVERFIQHLKDAVQYRDKIRLNTFDFHAIQIHIRTYKDESEICELALKILCEESKESDELIASFFKNESDRPPPFLCKYITSYKLEDRYTFLRLLKELPHAKWEENPFPELFALNQDERKVFFHLLSLFPFEQRNQTILPELTTIAKSVCDKFGPQSSRSVCVFIKNNIEKDRFEFFKTIKPILETIDLYKRPTTIDMVTTLDIIEYVKRIPEYLRAQVLAKAFPYVEKETISKMHDIFSTISTYAICFFQMDESILQGLSKGNIKASISSILRWLDQIPEKKRETRVRVCIELTPNCTNGIIRSTVLSILKDISDNDLNRQEIRKLSFFISQESRITCFVEKMVMMWPLVMDNILPVNDEKEAEAAIAMMEEIYVKITGSKIQEFFWRDTIKNIAVILKGCNPCDKIFEVIQFFIDREFTIPSSLDALSPAFEGITDYTMRLSIVEACLNRKDKIIILFIEKIVQELAATPDGEQRVKIIKSLINFPISELNPDTVHGMSLLIPYLKDDCAENSSFVSIVFSHLFSHGITDEDIVSACQFIQTKFPLIPTPAYHLGLMYAYLAKDGKEIVSNPPQEFRDFFVPNYFILADRAKKADPEHLKMFCLIFFAMMSPEKRTKESLTLICEMYNFCILDDLDKIIDLFPKDTKTIPIVLGLIPYICPCVQKTMRLIAYLLRMNPEIVIEAIQILRQENPQSLFRNERIRESCCKYWQTRLESSATPSYKWELSKWILTSYPTLNLHEEHPLIQLAITTAAICDPDALNNPKNPYRIYAEHKKALTQAQPVSYVLPSDVICGKTVAWNVEKLHEKSLWNGYSVKDIPQGVSSHTVKDLIDSLEKRMNDMPSESQGKLKKYILDTCEASYEKLRSNLLDQQFLSGLMTIGDNKDDPISPSKFQLLSILKAVIDLDADVPNNGLLTSQEEMLFKMAASVQHCSTGQRDGLANFYNALPSKYKLGPKAQESAETRAENFVESGLQKVINAIFSEDAFLVDVLGTKTIAQPSHVTEYLKNRYYWRVGLKHQITFDMHTGVLDAGVLHVTPTHVLEAFFHFCTIQKVVHQLVIDSPEAFQDKLFMGLMALIERIEGKDLDHRLYFVFDEETLEPQKLTEAGALAILQSCGYIRQI